MKKLTFIILACLFGILSIQAQSHKVTVSGSVLDEDGKTPIMQATVQILNMEGKYVNGAASLQSGHFQLPAVAAGKYTLKVYILSLLHCKLIIRPLQNQKIKS